MLKLVQKIKFMKIVKEYFDLWEAAFLVVSLISGEFDQRDFFLNSGSTQIIFSCFVQFTNNCLKIVVSFFEIFRAHKSVFLLKIYDNRRKSKIKYILIKKIIEFNKSTFAMILISAKFLCIVFYMRNEQRISNSGTVT